MKILTVILLSVFLLLSLFSSLSYPGEIEIGGKWYSFGEILPKKNVEAQTRKSGLTVFRGAEDELLNKPARILMILGDRWSKCFSDSQFGVKDTERCLPNTYLSKRFWSLRDPALVILERDASFYYTMSTIIHPAVKKESGWYELELAMLFTRESEEARNIFGVLVDIVDAEKNNRDFNTLSCIEMRGFITWSGLYNRNNPDESRYTYSFRVDSIKLLGTIPDGYGRASVLSLEEATVRCSSH